MHADFHLPRTPSGGAPGPSQEILCNLQVCRAALKTSYDLSRSASAPFLTYRACRTAGSSATTAMAASCLCTTSTRWCCKDPPCPLLHPKHNKTKRCPFLLSIQTYPLLFLILAASRPPITIPPLPPLFHQTSSLTDVDDEFKALMMGQVSACLPVPVCSL